MMSLFGSHWSIFIWKKTSFVFQESVLQNEWHSLFYWGDAQYHERVPWDLKFTLIGIVLSLNYTITTLNL